MLQQCGRRGVRPGSVPSAVIMGSAAPVAPVHPNADAEKIRRSTSAGQQQSAFHEAHRSDRGERGQGYASAILRVALALSFINDLYNFNMYRVHRLPPWHAFILVDYTTALVNRSGRSAAGACRERLFEEVNREAKDPVTER